MDFLCLAVQVKAALYSESRYRQLKRYFVSLGMKRNELVESGYLDEITITSQNGEKNISKFDNRFMEDSGELPKAGE